MYDKSDDCEKWKQKIGLALDNWVATNFERLYFAARSDYNTIWGEISSELYKKEGLIGIMPDDSEYLIKRQKQRYISLLIEIYSEEEFPFELHDERTCRFVKQYGKLPKQAPDEWDKFELEERVKAGEARRLQIKRFKDALNKRYAASQ